MSPSVAIIGTRGYPSYYGGFETAIRKVAPILATAGWDVTVYGRPGSTRSNDPDRDERIAVKETFGVESKSLSTLSYGLTATLDAVRRKPDVALVMNVANGFWLPVLNARQIPSLVNVDGIEWDRAKWGRAAKSVFRLGARATARFGSRLVYDAVAIAERWSQEFGRDGDFIPYGGDVPVELPIEPGFVHRGYVLLVARFVPENTVAEFIGAAEQIAKRWPVIIVGSSGYGGDLEDEVAKLSAQNAKINWLGHVSDDERLLALWQHAGVYFHGHSVGGTNPALVQAMACGSPIVARDTIYNREVLGENGIFCEPTSDDIAEVISRVMNQPSVQDRTSVQNQARAIAVYSWAGVGAAYDSSLRMLLAKA